LITVKLINQDQINFPINIVFLALSHSAP